MSCIIHGEITSFYIYRTSDGNMPVLFYKKTYLPHHPYYVRYVNNKPVAYHGPLTVLGNADGKIYDYSTQRYVDNVPSE